MGQEKRAAKNERSLPQGAGTVGGGEGPAGLPVCAGVKFEGVIPEGQPHPAFQIHYTPTLVLGGKQVSIGQFDSLVAKGDGKAPALRFHQPPAATLLHGEVVG